MIRSELIQLYLVFFLYKYKCYLFINVFKNKYYLERPGIVGVMCHMYNLLMPSFQFLLDQYL